MKDIEILLNCAISADGFLGRKGEKTKLSNEEDWRQVHLLRETFDVILVGAETIRTDNPSLRVKKKWLGRVPKRHPHRVVLTISGNIPKSSRVLDARSPTTIFSSFDGRKALQNKEIGRHIEIIETDTKEVVGTIMKWMKSKNYRRLFVEGGSRMFMLFLQSGLRVRFRIFRSPLLLGANNGVPLVHNMFAGLRRIRTYLLGDGTVDLYEKC